MKKSIEIDASTMFVLILVFIVAFSFILYQRFQYASLLEEYIDISWQLQDSDANVVYFKGLYEKCDDLFRSSD